MKSFNAIVEGLVLQTFTRDTKKGNIPCIAILADGSLDPIVIKNAPQHYNKLENVKLLVKLTPYYIKPEGRRQEKLGVTIEYIAEAQ